jgi:uroporphyrinogen-III synthase
MLTILNTRPKEQAGALTALLKARGCAVIEQPLLHIGPPPEPEVARKTLIDGLKADAWVSVSANAVDGAHALLGTVAPTHPTLVAVGPTTAQRIQRLWQRTAVVPAQRHDSEGVLALKLWAHVQNAILLAAPGGRDLLTDALRGRGIDLKVVHTYQRAQVNWPKPMLTKLRGARQLVTIATSQAALDALHEVANNQQLEQVLDAPIVVASARIGERAQQLKFREVRVARSASDAELAAAALNGDG